MAAQAVLRAHALRGNGTPKFSVNPDKEVGNVVVAANTKLPTNRKEAVEAVARMKTLFINRDQNKEIVVSNTAISQLLKTKGQCIETGVQEDSDLGARGRLTFLRFKTNSFALFISRYKKISISLLSLPHVSTKLINFAIHSKWIIPFTLPKSQDYLRYERIHFLHNRGLHRRSK